MKLSLLTSLLGAVSSVMALTAPIAGMGCGNQLSDEDVRQIELGFPAYKVDSDVHPTAATLNVIFHVISKDGTFQGGNIPDALIQKQIQVLNQDFAKTGITYRLVAIDRTINPNWFDLQPQGTAQTQMKQALRKGGPADLNIYSVGYIHDGPNQLRGYATFPWEFQSRPGLDGVVIVFSSMPGGLKPYDLGRTTTHEVGHWVGLYHPFQGGCTAPGDYVEDTPYEATASFGCNNGRDSCPILPGADPIHNFMDYSDDSCVSEFTQGQYLRLRAAMLQFRGVRI